MDERYALFANAIVEQAVADYREALRGREVNHTPPNRVLQEVTDFFHSDWYAILTSVDPDRLLKTLYEEFKQGEKLLEAGEKVYKGTPFGEFVKFTCPNCGKHRAKFRIHDQYVMGGNTVYFKKAKCTKCRISEFRQIKEEEANGFKD